MKIIRSGETIKRKDFVLCLRNDVGIVGYCVEDKELRGTFRSKKEDLT
jgi:hypothetical protein